MKKEIKRVITELGESMGMQLKTEDVNTLYDEVIKRVVGNVRERGLDTKLKFLSAVKRSNPEVFLFLLDFDKRIAKVSNENKSLNVIRTFAPDLFRTE
jgi:hypothetical protein